jgi:phage tail sheath protein FI
MDNSKGFWWSPSNQEIYGITGMSRPVDFNISDPNTQANYLNENEVATIIRHEGFRLWGNRTTSSDPNWAFLSVRRTADMVYESLEEAFLWAVDRPFSQNNIVEIAESVNAYLRHLRAVGAILNGRAWIDPTVNTKDQMLQGILAVDFDIEPPAPIEHLRFRAHRNPDYYEELIADVIRELAI